MIAPRFVFTAISIFLPVTFALAWGEPHLAITRAALNVLPVWQQELLGDQREPLWKEFCLIPDNVYSDKANAKFAAMESKPGEVYITSLHLPAQQPENLEILRYFVGKAVASVRENKISDAARFMGTICHQLEDYGSPSHTIPGDNQFTLFQQFMPATEVMKDKLLHGPVENGEWSVSINGYKPALLGTSVDEVAWRLLHRVNEGIINARSTTIPIIQALYADDKDGVLKHQQRAATMDAKVVADALHSVMCLGTGRFETEAKTATERVGISSFWPLEAENLYYPQSQFFSSPFWGCPHSGVTLAGGNKSTPLRLRVGGEMKTFAEGISAGMGRSLTFLLPKDVYGRFTVLAGLHAELGGKGRVEFTVSGDGRKLAATTLTGTDPAQKLECDLAGIEQLKLTLTSRGLDPKSNYAIWAEPSLVKKP